MPKSYIAMRDEMAKMMPMKEAKGKAAAIYIGKQKGKKARSRAAMRLRKG